MKLVDALRNIDKNSLGSMTLALTLLAVAGCKSGTLSWDRHNISRIHEGPQKDVIYFDTAVTAEYPESSAAAEEIRKEWISEWLEIRNLCVNGHEVLSRRAFTREDDNPYRHDLRYELRCTP